MEKDYYSAFADSFFYELRTRVKNNLLKGENVLISGISGCGLKTIPNLIKKDVEKFFNIVYIDTENITNEGIITTVKKHISNDLDNLVIIKYLNYLEPAIVEKLSSMQYLGKSVVFLIISNLDPVKNPLKFNSINDNFIKRIEILTTYSIDQTFQALEVNNNYFNFKISKEFFDEIYEITGGITRFIKYVPLNISEGKYKIGESFDNLYYDPSILFECDLLTNTLLTYDTLLLKKIGLLDEKGKIKSTLLKDYFIKFLPAQLKTEFPSLSDYELKILSFMYINIGSVVTFEKIGDLINMNDFNYSLWAVYKQISRIKAKIKNKYTIESIRSSGYKLTQA